MYGTCNDGLERMAVRARKTPAEFLEYESMGEKVKELLAELDREGDAAAAGAADGQSSQAADAASSGATQTAGAGQRPHQVQQLHLVAKTPLTTKDPRLQKSL